MFGRERIVDNNIDSGGRGGGGLIFVFSKKQCYYRCALRGECYGAVGFTAFRVDNGAQGLVEASKIGASDLIFQHFQGPRIGGSVEPFAHNDASVGSKDFEMKNTAAELDAEDAEGLVAGAK